MRRKRKDKLQIQCVEENGEPAVYIVLNGVRIAQRGKPDTPHARSWGSLEPGWVVRDVNAGEIGDIVIEHHGASIQ